MTASAQISNAAPSPTVAPAVPSSIKKILVAIDHEDHAALRTALDLAAALRAQVAIVNVLEPVTVLPPECPTVYAEALDHLRANAQDLLKNVEAQLPQNARAFTCLREGITSREIVAAADEWPADLIVMGTHQKGALARTFLGSASQGVVRHSHCPVLLVNDVPAESNAIPCV